MAKKKTFNTEHDDKLELERFAAEERSEQKLLLRKKKRDIMISDSDFFLLDSIMLAEGKDFTNTKERDEFICQLIRRAHKALPKPRIYKEGETNEVSKQN